MKKFLNDPDALVPEFLAGLQAAHPDTLTVDLHHRIVLRADAPRPGKVAILSGGGSGHEPMHAGFVGRGMLDAACCGGIFTSPAPGQILAATRAVDAGVGVLYLVKNYTGDVMNFGLAAAEARATGTKVESVTITDDVALGDAAGTPGRRGTALTPVIEKLAGALAERGGSLEEIAALARRANERGGTLGVALTSCVNPASGRATIALSDVDMEFGVGIHGEPGRRRDRIRAAAEIVAEMTAAIVEDLGLVAGDEVLAFVNGAGGTPLIELYLVYNELELRLRERGIVPVRRLVGNYVTSLDMAGVSITLLHVDEELLTLWDDPVATPGLRYGV